MRSGKSAKINNGSIGLGKISIDLKTDYPRSKLRGNAAVSDGHSRTGGAVAHVEAAAAELTETSETPRRAADSFLGTGLRGLIRPLE